MKEEYGWGGHSGALPGSFHSYENHDGKGVELKKSDCVNVQLPWSTVAKRITELIRKGRYLTSEEHTRYEKLQRDKAETDSMPKIEYDAYKDYSAIKDAHADDIVLYQVGDFFEFYGEAKRRWHP